MVEVHQYFCDRCGKTSWLKLRVGWTGPHSPEAPKVWNVCDDVSCSADILEREAHNLRALFDNQPNDNGELPT